MATKIPSKSSKPAPASKQTSPAPKKKPGEPKQVSNASSTGGTGISFEHRVQASKLLALALGAAALGIPGSGRIVQLQFQAKRAAGPNTDDLVCTVKAGDDRNFRVFMQMKRGLTARPSDTAFAESVGHAWLDYRHPDFRRDADRIVVIHDGASTHDMQGARDVARTATTSLDAADWMSKLTAPGSGNAGKRSALAALRDIVDLYNKTPVSDDEFLEFMKVVEFLAQDLDSDGTAEHASYLNLISSSAAAVGVPVDANAVWSQLVTTCMRLNGESGAVDYSNLAIILDDRMALWFDSYRRRSGARFPEQDLADQANLRVLFSEMYLPHIETFIARGKQSQVFGPIIHYYAGIQEFVMSAQYQIHDPDLASKVKSFEKSLREALSYLAYFRETSNPDLQVFDSRVHDIARDSAAADAHEDYLQAIYDTERSLHALCAKVSQRFPGLSFQDTNAAALRNYNHYQQKYQDA